MRTDHPVVVLGLFETGLAVARSLGRNGVHVVAVGHRPCWASASKYVSEFLICPHPLTEEAAFCEFLSRRFGGHVFKPVLMVTADEFLIAVSRNRASLADSFLIGIPEERLLESIVDKYAQARLAEGCGVATPATHCPAAQDDVDELAARLHFPVVVKGRYVAQWRRSLGAVAKAFVVDDARDLARVLSRIWSLGIEPIVQEVISGPDANHYKVCVYVSPDGKLRLCFGLRKIRQSPPRLGAGSAVRSLAWPQLLATGLSLFQGLKYTGVGSAEFKLEERDGRLKLIELNPRYWQQNWLAAQCGMDFPVTEYRELTGQQVACPSTFEEGVVWVSPAADLRSAVAYMRSGELSISGWLGSLRGKRVLADFSWDDPRPFVRRILSKAA